MRPTSAKLRGLLAAALAVCAAGAASVSCRRPLWVAGDEYRSAVLHTDWRSYQKNDPGGMTAWFFPEDEQERSYSDRTSNVRQMEFYLPSGRYTGVVIDYSPEEYARQEFLGMDRASTAHVRATPSGYQPDSIAHLFGAPCFHGQLPASEGTGLYEVSNQPEQMALDTLRRMEVLSGEYGYYIPYEEQDTYQENLVIQHFYAYPVTPVWKLRARIYVKGIDYLWDIQGSVAGLSSGRWLALNRALDEPCLIGITEWDVQRTGDNEGYVAATISTFGLPGNRRPLDTRTNNLHEETVREQVKESAVIVDWDGTEPLRPEDVRLNLRFLLRDRSTIRYAHFDVGELVVSYDNELVLRIDLDRDYPDCPDLPFVEPFNGAGFDAVVLPWEKGGEADVPL